MAPLELLPKAPLPHPMEEPARLPAAITIPGPRGYLIPVRRFGMEGKGRPVVMLHGLESHSGWFVRSASRIAQLGLPVHAFDRCGSGVSGADAQLGSRLDDLLAEVDAVSERALHGTPHQSVHLVGHCFGAMVALMYAALHRPGRVASLVLCTPALYTHTDLSLAAKLRVSWSVLTGRPAGVPIPLSPDDFSELEPFVTFVRQDPLVLRTAPARLFYEIWRARQKLDQAVSALRAPVMAALASADVICDNRRNRRLLERVGVPRELREYPGARHILEFSGQRESFLDDLAAWLSRWEVT